jgi:3-deoxy-7-phosphoheptulonate synthase
MRWLARNSGFSTKVEQMIIVLQSDITPAQLASLQSRLERRKLQTRLIDGAERKVLAVIGSVDADTAELAMLEGVSEVIRVGRPYKLASREAHKETSTVRIGPNVVIGGPQLVVMAGPCSVESREGLLDIARKVKEAGANVLRAGAFKPRSSPYAFQGMGREGLEILAEARELYGLPIVTEVMSPAQVELVCEFADLLQIGARNMQNFELLKAVAEARKPVLLKRGLSATIEEFLMSAEYVLAGGNQVILCERGIRTFEPSTRNTLDLSAVPVIRSLSHLPIIVDPSHGTGHRNFVASMALAGVAAGADGLMIEVHPNPPEAMSDGAQSLYPGQFAKVMRDVAAIAPVVGRHHGGYQPVRSKATAAASNDLVAYQGEPGAFSEAASRRFFGAAVQTVPCRNFYETFRTVSSGQTRYALLPLENSLGGSIHQNYDLLLEHPDLTIVGEVHLRVVHNLIANPGVVVDDIRRVYAHPQAAAQCEEFLRTHPDWEVVNLNDTAGSVRHVKDHGLRDAAAIASAQAAKLLEMEVLAEGIETHPRNFTRFVALTRVDSATPDLGADKVSVVLETDHSPGALSRVLEILSARQVNLVKLESRPIPGKPWQYLFYVDLLRPTEGALLEQALAEVAEVCPMYRCLGTYRSAVG